MQLDRRQFLRRSAAAAAAATTGGGLFAPGAAMAAAAAPAHAAGATDSQLEQDAPLQVDHVSGSAPYLKGIPFEGAHQAGIENAVGLAGTVVAFDVTTTGKANLAELFRTITARAQFLTAGGRPAAVANRFPPVDSGTLGPVVVADGLTVTLGVGASLFDDRFGLHGQRPANLTVMRSFPNDELDLALCGGDLVLQICAGSTDTVIHALRDIVKHTREAMQIRWRIDGFGSPPRPSGVSRNHFGFHDGIVNPDVADATVADKLLWVGAGGSDPVWAVGGSYYVVRIIKMLIEFWDRVSLNEQQVMIGRRRGDGAPLGEANEASIPDYASDPKGKRIPLNSHIRLANPRTDATAGSRILRRGFNYDRGVDNNGNLDLGLLFTCFQQNIARQFEATQKRLIDEPMADYITPVGGGYFLMLPGVRDVQDWLGRALIAAAV